MELRLPDINTTTQEGNQIKSYLYQFVQELNWALENTVTKENFDTIVQTSSSVPKEKSSTDKFNEIKSLILNSADLIKAYEETMTQDFESKYFADSDFGTYIRETNNRITTSADNIESLYTITETINDTLNTTLGYIKTGVLETIGGNAIIGIEIGQTNNETFQKYARFTNEKLSFYDNDTEIAYISNKKLYINEAEISNGIKIGKYKIETGNGLAFSWIGG